MESSLETNKTKEDFSASTEVIQPSEKLWSEIGEKLHKIECIVFGKKAQDPFTMNMDFQRPGTSIVILKKDDDKSIIGFTYATLNLEDEDDTAIINCTALLPEYQNKGLVAQLMKELEADLKKKGYKYMERHAMIMNGYSEKIKKNYSKRIVKEYGQYTSEFGNQVYFKIKL